MRQFAGLALCGVLAACGGSNPGPITKANISLLATTPVPNGTLDRWADLHFTFSADVTWTGVQLVDCISVGCRSPKVPYRFASAGVEVVGTPILPPEFGQTYSMRITPLLAVKDANGNTAANIDFSWSALPAATRVTADVTADTALSAAGSPYWFDPAVRIRAKLTIPVGVEVAGDLVTAGAGSVEAIGLPATRVRISNAVLSGAARLSYVDMLGTATIAVTGNVDHSAVYCTRVGPAGGHLTASFSGSLTDSKVSGCEVQSLAGSIQRNAFVGSSLPLGGTATQGTPPSSTDTVWTSSTQFVNNYVSPAVSNSYSGVFPSVCFRSSGAVVRGNSFNYIVNGFPSAGYFIPTAESASADLSGNWWGTTDMATIGSYFHDANYGGVGGVRPNPPVVTPILTAPDPATPTG